MDLKGNLSRLEIDSTKNTQGYSLRKNAFYGWLGSKKFGIEHVAKKLLLSVQELENKLKHKEKFTYEQLKRFINLAKAPYAFHILYFDSFSERERIYKILFNRAIPKKIRKHKKVVKKNE